MRELWLFSFIFIYTHNYILCFQWGCDGRPERKLAATAPSLFLSEGGCGENRECRAGDLWPRGRLISAVTSPDVRLAVSPSQLITFTHIHTHTHAHACNRTAQHTATHRSKQSPRPLLTVPQSCCMLSCSRQTAVFSALPFFCCPQITPSITTYTLPWKECA